ncbi:hypothetical protein FRC02_009241 [Tulasnella sp. 418]|nr:hypothetical protein FRC02_009241 [Tulasnella sp. 418]
MYVSFLILVDPAQRLLQHSVMVEAARDLSATGPPVRETICCVQSTDYLSPHQGPMLPMEMKGTTGVAQKSELACRALMESPNVSSGLSQALNRFKTVDKSRRAQFLKLWASVARMRRGLPPYKRA